MTARRTDFWIFAVLTVLSAAGVAFGLPHNREVGSLAEFVLKLIPFILAAETIARLDVEAFRRLGAVRVLIPLCFLVFFAYFVPRVFYWGGVRTEDEDAFGSLYYTVLLLVPFMILALTLAYRLGGGSPRVVRRLAYGMLLIMVSGIEDLAFLTVNDLRGTPFDPIPQTWTWPSHMKVRLGHWPSKEEAFAFIGVHLTLALVVLATPDRVVDRVWARRPGARRVDLPQDSDVPA